MDDAPTTPPTPAEPRAIWPVLLVPGAFLAACAWAISTARIPWRVANDQVLYHEPAVREFARQWPMFDLADYLSVTTPLYHLLLAALVKVGLASTAALQGVSAVIGAGLVMLVGVVAARRGGGWRAAVFTLPLAASTYVFQSAAWILPDDLAWLGVSGVIALCLRGRWNGKVAVLSGVLLAALVFTRQNHLWAAGAVWAAAWAGEDDDAPVLRPTDARMGRLAVAVCCTLPAFAVIGWLALMWGGLTPARYRTFHQGANLSTPAFVLAVIGAAGLFYLPTLLGPLACLWREARRWVFVSLVLGVAVAAISPTTYDEAAGRWTGLWNLARHAPTAGHVSLALAPLVVAGAVALTAWISSVHPRRQFVAMAALAGFTLAQTANMQCWQRYIEPFVLILTAWAASGAAPAPPRVLRRVEMVGPLVLAGLLAWLNIAAMRDAPPITGAVAPGTLPMGGPYMPGKVAKPTP